MSGVAPVQKRLYLGRAAALVAAMCGFAAAMALTNPQCGFARVFHVPCPGCGTTRATWALLSLHPIDALRFNPAAPFIVLLLGVIAAQSVVAVGRDGNVDALGSTALGKWSLRLLLAATAIDIVVWALRFLGLFGGPVAIS